MEKFGLRRMHSLRRTFSNKVITSFKKALRIVGNESNSVPDLQFSMKGLSNTSFIPEAYILARRRMHEIETEKAMATFMSRHESWKAGGPQ